MSDPTPPNVLKDLSFTRYHGAARLVTWHPRGVFDDVLADRIIDFMETQEQIRDAPFDRYADLNGLTEIHLKVGHAFQIVERRREGYSGPRVKSAIVSKWVVGFGIARMYEALMKDAQIEVRAFHDRAAAAEWLGVPEGLLQGGAENPSP